MEKDLFKTFFSLQKSGENEPFVQKQPPEVFLRKEFSKNFTKIKRKQLCWSLFLIKILARCFPMNFLKFSRTTFLQNTFRRLLLFVIYLTGSFCKEVLYFCSNLLLLEKWTKTHNCAIFSFCKYILYSILWMHFIL